MATTPAYGRAIFAASDNPSQGTVMVGHLETGDTIGDPRHLFYTNGYIFFFDKRNSDDTFYRPYVLDVSDGSISQIFFHDGDTLTGLQGQPSYFTAVGSKIYFLAAFQSGNHVDSLISYDVNSGYVDLLNEYYEGLAPTGNAGSANASDGASANIFAVGTKLYFLDQDGGRSHGFDVSNGSAFDLTDFAGEWQPQNQVLYGAYEFNGEQGLLLGAPMMPGEYRTFFIGSSGQPTQLDNQPVRDGKSWFINFDGRLFENARLSWGGAGLYEVTTPSGYRVPRQLVSDGINMSLNNAIVVGNKLVFSQYDKLYQWSGSGLASEIANVRSTSDSDLYADPFGGPYQRNTSIAQLGSGLVTNIYADPAVGFAPYRVSLSGSMSLVAATNTVSAGSNPDFSCSSSDSGADYIVNSTLSSGANGLGKSVTIATERAGKLLYRVVDLSALSSACGFVTLNGRPYFIGTDGAGTHLFIINSQGIAESIGDLGSEIPLYAFTDGKSYFYVAQSDEFSAAVLIQVSLSTGDVIRLTGPDLEPGIRNVLTTGHSGASAPAVMGNKIFFAAEDISGNILPYVATIGANSMVSVQLVASPQTREDYSFMTAGVKVYGLGGRVVFVTGSNGDNFYEVRQDTDEIEFWFTASGDLNSGQGSSEATMVSGNLYFIQSSGDQRSLYRWNGATAAVINVPEFQPLALANVGNRLLVVGDTEAAFYDGTNFNFVSGLFGPQPGNLALKLKAGLRGVRGIYLSSLEQPNFWPSANNPWGMEAGYFGSLIPQNTSRKGVRSYESPASSYTSPAPTGDLQAPSTPVSVSATQTTGGVNLKWVLPEGSAPADNFAVTSTPTGAECEAVGNNAYCTGMETGTYYTFTVRAINSAGSSAQSGRTKSVRAPIQGSIPIIDGDIRVGKTVQAVLQNWTSGVSFDFQWKLNGANIPGANASEYTLQPSDFGKKLSVQVSGSLSGLPTVRYSTPVDASGLVKSDVIRLFGKAAQGQTLTVDPGFWDDGSPISYQWLRDGSPISRARSASYQIRPSDAGSRLSVSVSGLLNGDASGVTSVQTATVPYQQFAGLSRISISSAYGDRSKSRPGTRLCATTSEWDERALLTYQWFKNGNAVDGATSRCFTGVGNDDVGATYTAKATAAASGFKTKVSVSNRIAIVAWGFGAFTKPWVVADSYESGLEMSAGVDFWVDLYSYWADVRYQWYRNNTAIDGATAKTYTLSKADIHTRITFRVTISSPGYTTVVLVSSPTNLILK